MKGKKVFEDEKRGKRAGKLDERKYWKESGQMGGIVKMVGSE